MFFPIREGVFYTMSNRQKAEQKGFARTVVREPNRFVMSFAYCAIRLWLFFCGVRIHAVNKVGIPDKPSITLCNHGSFIDFIFASTLVRKFRPNFIVSRLYFYNTCLGWLLRTVGAFPKSMFAMDLENAKNCLKVLRSGDRLVMMPEARLSTTGRFEDIQDNTYAFIKKAGVSVYTVKLCGDYLANPKWAKDIRRGAVVEAELDILYTADEVKRPSPEELQRGIEKRLAYNEFEWLKTRPGIHYRSRHMAEGLENILTTCPLCGRRHVLTAKKNQIFCEHCGYLTSVDDRYAFTGDFRFANLTEWYDWQQELLKEEILADPDYALTSKVELRLPGTGGSLTRHGGEGICTLNREGLTYEGTKDGEQVRLFFSIRRIYRLLFGAGVNFEVYVGSEIHFFVPEEKRSAIDWYMISRILHDMQ